MTNFEAHMVGIKLADDYGTWCNYLLFQADFKYAWDKGLIKAKLSKDEYDSVGFDKYEKGDPAFLLEFYKRMAFKTGELGTAFGEGSGRLAARWGFGQDYYGTSAIPVWSMGHPKHHSSENNGQVGVLVNLVYNRDAQIHSASNFIQSGLPIGVMKRIGAKVFGSEDAVDAMNNYTPMNVYKAKFAKWALLRKELHDSLTLCNWMGPWLASPLKERNYEGDNGIEAKIYSLATGDEKSTEELDAVAERIFNLHRALTIRDMGTKEMRAEHDTIPPRVTEYPHDNTKPFTPGTYKMDKADLELAKNMFHTELGWDGATGAPTRFTYERLGLKDVADSLAETGLL